MTKFLANPALICPIDQLPLLQQDNSLCCENKHSYDIARQGYVNLMSASDKRSKDPGDSKAMVVARRDFFDGGFYQPLAQHLYQLLAPLLKDNCTIVDAGCGEGYYPHYLQQQFAAAGNARPEILGFDISKWAVQAAAKRCPATWMVASNRNIPIADNTADAILSLFGFPAYASFRRVLKAESPLLLVNAGQQHLIELREVIYPEIKASQSRELEQALAAGFTLRESSPLTFKTPALGKQAISQLLGMTPHLFRATHEGKERASQLEQLAVTVDVNFYLLY
jgi:23S rRNA (guanine745-N1)-methyltransferase